MKFMLNTDNFILISPFSCSRKARKTQGKEGKREKSPTSIGDKVCHYNSIWLENEERKR